MPSPAFPCSYLLLLKIAHFKFHKLTLNSSSLYYTTYTVQIITTFQPYICFAIYNPISNSL